MIICCEMCGEPLDTEIDNVNICTDQDKGEIVYQCDDCYYDGHKDEEI